MSYINASTLPVFTISIGTAGTFTDDSNVDIASQVNAEIAAAPVGDAIKLVFSPGDYGVGSPILIPSNTSVSGYGATLKYIAEPNGSSNFALLANADAYVINIFAHLKNLDGSSTTLQIWNANETSDTQTMAPGTPGMLDSNISVQGLTFDLGNAHIFGTWFINATSLDVQNNTYIGGTDGNAFVNVVNGLVAANLAIGQNNSAYDNWNGPTAITVEDNAAYMSGTPNSGWSVLMNSTPTGDPNNPGNANNDGIIGNLFSSGLPGELAVNANALTSYGFTTETLIVQQGNIDSQNGMPNETAIYTRDPASNLFIQNNIVSGINASQGSISNSNAFAFLSSGSGGVAETNAVEVTGNVAQGSFRWGQSQLQNCGNNPVTQNNMLIGLDASPDDFVTNAITGTATQSGNVTVYGRQITGTTTQPKFNIAAPPDVFAAANTAIRLSGISIEDLNSTDSLSVTLLTQFGTLSLSPGMTATPATLYGETGYVLSGSVTQLNTELNNLSYASNASGWDDSVEIIVSQGSAIVADRYVPIIDLSGTNPVSSLTTLNSADLVTLGLQPQGQDGSLSGPNFSGGAILAEAGDHAIRMGGSISLVFLGSGDNTVTGGAKPGYITTGQGVADIHLTGGGNFTIAGGSGTLKLDAAKGNNLIQPGAGNATVIAGSGTNMLLGGLGNLSVTGGSGRLLLETLPQDGGNLDATLGIGGGTIIALSGNATLATEALATDLIYLGLGNTTLQSGGHDVIHTGLGSSLINATAGGSDYVFGGTGHLTFIGGANPAIIDPAFSSTLTANDGNMKIQNGGEFLLRINAVMSGHRVIVLPSLSQGVTLQGYGAGAIARETMSGTTLTITLSDGTIISLQDRHDFAVHVIKETTAKAVVSGWSSSSAGSERSTTWRLAFSRTKIQSQNLLPVSYGHGSTEQSLLHSSASLRMISAHHMFG